MTLMTMLARSDGGCGRDREERGSESRRKGKGEDKAEEGAGGKKKKKKKKCEGGHSQTLPGCKLCMNTGKEEEDLLSHAPQRT
eukprot:CAMPEP_0206456886 /NCGR_PEP_ID=MMETSP0324_2-20121206/22633_1 /ASSEMBLY_ACC=CAM_ASM_000836 /TAXON_ID=2866 /ORGANISM="Crypthecodinium cohnii, Strain Seligo" /LENGTH=82 /DNA_ID=CAMNT_0053927903 /DNA_START=281 /DNA_END=526 /DNA_ORIENTATION=+